MNQDVNQNELILKNLRDALEVYAVPPEKRKAVFFKTGPGGYAEHDQFLGVSNPQLRQIAKNNYSLPLEVVVELLQSPINEERLLALFILVARYQKSAFECKEMIYCLYQTHIKHINNWNLVDASAHLIMGAHLYSKDKSYLAQLAVSDSLWERRIAIVATLYFIRKNDFVWTVKIAELLLNDQHDLIHKAVGWMLREMGKRHEAALIDFLDLYAHQMPRTMLRYSIEKLNVEQRAYYLAYKR